MTTSKKTTRVTVSAKMRLGDLRCERGVALNLTPGKYLVDAHRANLGGIWGMRTVKVEGLLVGQTSELFWNFVGQTAVDSGEVGLGLPAGDVEDVDDDFEEEPAYVFRTTSGLGDGCYAVEIARENNGRRVGFRVTFLDDKDVAKLAAQGAASDKAEKDLRTKNPLNVVPISAGIHAFVFRGLTFRCFGENYITMPVVLERNGEDEISPQGFRTIPEAYNWLVHMTELSDHLKKPFPRPATDEQIKAETDARMARAAARKAQEEQNRADLEKAIAAYTKRKS